jgi:hypothetical protein
MDRIYGRDEKSFKNFSRKYRREGDMRETWVKERVMLKCIAVVSVNVVNYWVYMH